VLKDANIKSRFKRAPLVERVNFDSGLSLILDNYELLTVEKRSNRHVLGIAVDVGTTTICVSLCDLTNGEELATSTLLNMQSEYGADIISRLDFALKSQKNARRLNERVIFSINKAIDECAQKAGVGVHRIFSAVMVGNSAMQHLLLQLPLKSLISPPYRIALQGIVQMKAKSLKLNINPNANIRFLPSIGGFVGSDVLGTILSLRLFRKKQLSLCVDLGTNGEIILGSAKSLVVASTAAGPAFEGYRIKCGMVAKSGAIEWFRFDNRKINFQTIAHIEPEGICGSGIVDIVSELLKANIIDFTGRMNKKTFLIYKNRNKKIELVEKDVREIQLAKAAILAGIRILMKKMNVSANQIKHVFLAGALGNYLNIDNAINIGLLPIEFSNKISFVGNTAFLGAKLALLSKRELQNALRIYKKTEHVSLAEHSNFQDVFLKALHFPKN